MIKPEDFCLSLSELGIDYYAGVPDSLLKDICSYVDDKLPKVNHTITANEGSAIGLGIGYYLSTQKIPLIYMQNSGLGNATNPLLSLADSKVYSIPLMLMIGWRGQPNSTDEPQHIKQGSITKDLLEVMEIPFKIFSKDTNQASIKKDLLELRNFSLSNGAPSAILVEKGTFSSYQGVSDEKESNLMTRRKFLEYFTDKVEEDTIIVSTTGVTSRELLDVRNQKNQNTAGDFLTVGGMGHASQIALGIAIQKKEKRVICLDGDGSLLMHMGSLASIADSGCENYIYILLNNGVHDSVGGQAVSAKNINFPDIAKAAGFNKVYSINNTDDLNKIDSMLKKDGPLFLEMLIKPGFQENLIRPSKTPLENKKAFIDFINKF